MDRHTLAYEKGCRVRTEFKAYQVLKKNFLELTMLKHILRKSQQFFDKQEGIKTKIGTVAQLILWEKLPTFKKLLRQAGDQFFKSVLVIFFQGVQLKSRVMKIYKGFVQTREDWGIFSNKSELGCHDA